MTSALFSPISLRGLELRDRIVVAPMCQYVCEDGSVNDWHIMHLGQYAMGAAGLIIAEATHVSPIARITPKCAGLYSDENEAAWRPIIAFCRKYGVSALGVQLAHAGRKASTRAPLDGGGSLGADDGAWQTVSASDLPYDDDWHRPASLDDAGMAEIKAQFVSATERAARLGFDTVELHSAHGYLMHQFLSPISNRRNDGYGGTLEGRMRFPLEVFEATRAVWPDDRPLGVRVSATDWIEGGWTLEDTISYARELKGLGCDYIDVSSGGLDPRQQVTPGPGYQVPLAEAVRKAVGMPTMAVGMITEARQAEAIIADGQADFVALARGMMFDPRWAWHAAEELGVDTTYADQYTRCEPSRWPQAFPARQAAE